MTVNDIQEIIFRVLSEQNSAAPIREMEVPVEVSARHVHLTEKDIRTLFGAALTPKRQLSQPGQYLSEERVTLITPKGRIEHVAVLGPARGQTQVELSATDCRGLGIKAPVRLSGDLEGAGDIYLLGPKGMTEAKGSVIVAKAHIHMTPQDAAAAGIADGQHAAVTLPGQRPVTLEDVVCRVSEKAGLAIHIDSDEANACMLEGKTARIRVKDTAAAGQSTACRSQAGQSVVCRSLAGQNAAYRSQAGQSAVCRSQAGQDIGFAENSRGAVYAHGSLNGQTTSTDESAAAENTAATEAPVQEKLITEAVAERFVKEARRRVCLKKGTLITPLAKDVLYHAGISLIWQTGGADK